MATITIEGFGTVEAHADERLVLALERAGTGVLHRCGGVARCTTCRVEFLRGEPTPMTAAERDKLDEKGLLGSARLSCQIPCTGDMTVRVVQTEASTGLEAGKAPAPQIEPEPVWVERPSA
ncbi:2Fe-2S iron-sulfur cluster-binding protein [Deinococcus maricopensis]|uniref:Ferredoxin n=1 Tax=Deinococcus maricopensis (strain DSM 21211 / LMG 22137 / NRRL B-23946 / LB-34) TaxID=709986 RepID=E8U4J5_DEIML|nr:2Fe-2S iron-sulfur cluster-binding protein [Deinococcus maricopensis]ADV68860.1 ferredoxin [Deinococcus maricopensis DSM 21211]